MVRHFSDPRVGAVSGEEIRTVVKGTDPGAESMYWRYESAIKILESRLNCSQGGNGAALAVRSSLFRPTLQSIVEDFQVPLEIRFKGFRVVYDPEAIATEEITPTFSAQFARRVRIGAGNYQTLFRNPGYLNPINGLLTFSFISHRLLRWLGPLFLLTAFFSSIAMAADSKFGAVVTLQWVFYSTALIGYALKKRGRSAGLFAAPLHFCSMNLALLMGLYTYMTGRQGATWSVTPRASQPAQPHGSMDRDEQETTAAA
jgi:cellulose synthase/poly-beta-1,6-N-acetylglucosamine synthase-like glycosyltransferase